MRNIFAVISAEGDGNKGGWQTCCEQQQEEVLSTKDTLGELIGSEREVMIQLDTEEKGSFLTTHQTAIVAEIGYCY